MIKRKKLVFELVVELSEEHATAVFYEGVTKEEMMEAMGIATLVGGTIVIPHLRRAYEFWEALENEPV